MDIFSLERLKQGLRIYDSILPIIAMNDEIRRQMFILTFILHTWTGRESFRDKVRRSFGMYSPQGKKRTAHTQLPKQSN